MPSAEPVHVCRSKRRQSRTWHAVAIVVCANIPIALATVSFAQAKADAAGNRDAVRNIPPAFAGEDAVVLEHEQTWSIAGDGSTTCRESRSVLINNDRAIGAFADPRITYNADFESVRVITARTVCPDGRVVEVPAYSRNEVAPYETAGWTAFAAIRQLVITFGGVEPGAVLHFEWERTIKPGMHRFLVVDERLETAWPTLARRIRIPGREEPFEFRNLALVRDEPGSAPARERCRHFTWSNCPTQKDWVASLIEPLEGSSKKHEGIKSLASEWSADKSSAFEKAAAIQSAISRQFNFVRVPSAWMPDRLRTAEHVFAVRHGSEPEAAAVLTALFRSAGLTAQPFFATDDAHESGAESGLREPASPDFVPPPVVAYGVIVRDGGRCAYFHPEAGRIHDPGPWAGRSVYCKSDKEEAARTRLRGRGHDGPSQVLIDGKLTIGGDANWTASLNMSVAGLFCDRANLETQDQKRAAIQAILDRTLPGATLGDFSVTALSSLDSDAPADVDSGVKAAKGTNSMLTVTADVRGAGPLPELDGGRVLTLPQDGPWTSQISIPLGRTERKSDLRIAQAFTSSLQLEIAWPAQWHATAQPREYSSAKLKWGQARQTVSGKSDSLRIDQKLDVKARDIAHVDYASLREAISALQAPASRTLILRPAGP